MGAGTGGRGWCSHKVCERDTKLCHLQYSLAAHVLFTHLPFISSPLSDKNLAASLGDIVIKGVSLPNPVKYSCRFFSFYAQIVVQNI
jgi:hypothetical protein